LLKLRALVEESSRVELERIAALAARIDQAQERERAVIRESREEVVKTVSKDGEAGEQLCQRALEWSNVESAAWREQQLYPLARATAKRVEEGRAEFFEKRKERRQVESVLDAQRARMRAEQDRRMQRDLDDWFGMKQIRRALDEAKQNKEGVRREQS
jgi:hypothetical protein